MRLAAVGVAVAATMAMCIVAVTARPSQDIFLDNRRPVYRGNHRTRERKSDTAEVVVHGDINVMGRIEPAARGATSAPPLGESLKTVTKQLLTDPAATDMVATDLRTPPRVGTRHEDTGHGEAIPVETVEISSTISTPSPTPAATPRPSPTTPRAASSTHRLTTPTPGGLSTWILLSDLTTTASSLKKKPAPTLITKKPIGTVRPTATIEKIIKKGNETKVEKLSAAVASPLVATKKPVDPTAKPTIPFDSKFKNRTPVVVGRIPSANKTKPQEGSKKPSTTQLPITTIEVATKKKPTQLTAIKSTIFIPESVPTTSLLLESSTIGTPEDGSTTPSSSSTKKTRRPGTKNKKKKNKIRRRRPTKDSTTAQSKIDTDLAETKIEGYNRPLSTRIYNYLAREVMPNVGVGLVGLVLTAGLAGLLLYPFGGVVARRNYEKAPPPHDNNHMYYYNDYNPNNVEPGVVSPEDPVYGMSSNVNSYSPNYDSKYNNHYRYDISEYANENVNGYAGMKDYSTLPDSVKNTQYSTIPENNNYYNMEPMTPISPQYKEGDTPIDKYNIDESKYPSLTDYTAYTSASAVGTNTGIYEKPVQVQPPKEKDSVESKTESEEKEPHFSALAGAPNYSNTDFVGSVSVSGSYGAELGHRVGMLPMDHGPRNLKIKTSRRKRSAQDTINEIDAEIPEDKDSVSTESGKESSSNVEVSTSQVMLDVSTNTDKLESTTFTSPTTAKSVIVETHEPIIEVNIQTDDSHKGDYEVEQNEITKDPIENSIYNKYDVTTPQQDLSSDSNQVQEEYGFMAMLRRLFQMKLRVGINFIRSTSEAFQRYVNRVTQRMELAMRKLNRSSKANESTSRRKRELRTLKKNRPVKKHKQH